MTAPVIVRPSRAADAIVWIGFPLAGIAAGLLLSRVPGWLTQLPSWVFSLPFTPDREKITGLEDLMGTTALVVPAVVGLVLGVLLALTAYDERTTVRIDNKQVGVTLGDKGIGVVPRAGVAAALRQDGELVLIATDGTEPVRVKSDLGSGRLRSAFEGCDLVWLDEDPYEDEFTRWIDGAPQLDTYAHGILRAREKALESDQHDDARELRQEAARQLVVVRDRKGQQQWRRASGAHDGVGPGSG